MHKSLKQKGHLTRRRNVLSRAERIERLKEDETWDEEKASVFGLPKVKVEVITAPGRPRGPEKAEEGEEGEALAEGEVGETPEAAPGTPGARK